MSDMSCNRCGECCRRGGECTLRRWCPIPTPAKFEGRCEFLIDQPDGTATCERMANMDQEAAWFRNLVNGTCDFPELRKDIVPLMMVT